MHLADEAQWEQEIAEHITDPVLARAARGEQVDAEDLARHWPTWWLYGVAALLLGSGWLAGWYVI